MHRFALLARSAPLLLLAPVALPGAPPPALEPPPRTVETVPQAHADTLLGACELPGVPPPVECGAFEVWEDRDARVGRRISLRVVRLVATEASRHPDPILPLMGGPGQAATEAAPWLAEEFAELRRERDIVLVDQRGTGGSNGLECPLFGPPEDLQSYLGAFMPAGSVRACRPELERRADLTLYGTHVAADDLDELRAALGYERINLYGISYGTRLALTYLRRHGERARTLTLLGPYPPGRHGPELFGPVAQRALDGVLGDCQAEPACASAFPRIREEARLVFRSLEERPARVPVVHPFTGTSDTVLLSRELAAEAVRYMMYSPSAATFLPVALHQAASNDFAILAEQALFGRMRIVDGGANGLYLSITCAEEVAPADSTRAARLARGTFMGDYRYRDQSAACREWPEGRVAADAHDAVLSDIPVLLLTGRWDPVTPPEFMSVAGAGLSRGRELVIPHGGHGADGLEGGPRCLRALTTAFVRAGSAEGLDTACLEELRRPPFRTEPLEMRLAERPAAAPADLEGRYAADEGPLEIELEAAGAGVRVVLPDGATLLHVPVGPDRYRAVGLLGLYLRVEHREGRPLFLHVEQPGSPGLRLRRVD